MDYGYGMIAPPSEDETKARQQQMQQMMPVVERLLAGERVDGITPRLAQELMGIFTPEILVNMHERGYKVDPNWYQQYIPQGSVAPSVYGNVMGYSSAFGHDDMDPALKHGFAQWQEPVYNLPGGLSTFANSQLERQYQDVRASMQNYVYDWATNQWVLNPQAAAAQTRDVAADLGKSVTPNLALTELHNYTGLGGGTAEGSGESTVVPLDLQTQIAVNALKGGAPGLAAPAIVPKEFELPAASEPSGPIPAAAVNAMQTAQGLAPGDAEWTKYLEARRLAATGPHHFASGMGVRAAENYEAEMLGLDATRYSEVKKAIESVVLQNPNNPDLWLRMFKALGQAGLDFNKLNQLNPDWWGAIRQKVEQAVPVQ